MGQVLTADNLPDLVIASTTTITMATTYLGKSTRITIGGQQYKYSSLTTLNFGTTGFNGLDTGSIASNTLYYIYAVQSAGTPGLVASLAAPTVGPTGFAAWKEVGRCRTLATAATLAAIANRDGAVARNAAGTEWQSYTPTVSTGTWTNTRGYYRRVGSTKELKIYAGPLTGNGSGVYTWTLANGLAADFTAMAAAGLSPSIPDTDAGAYTLIPAGTATINNQGGAWYMDGTTPSTYTDARVYMASTTTVAVVGGSAGANNRANSVGSVDNLASVTGTIQIEARIPIVEWAGLFT